MLNSFALNLYHLNQWHEYSKGCSEQKPGGRVWMAPLTPHPPIHKKILSILSPKRSWSAPLILHLHCGHLGPGHCHLFPRLLVLTHLFACLFSLHTLFCSHRNHFEKWIQSQHHILPPAPSPPNTHSRALKILQCLPIICSKCWSATR